MFMFIYNIMCSCTYNSFQIDSTYNNFGDTGKRKKMFKWDITLKVEQGHLLIVDDEFCMSTKFDNNIPKNEKAGPY